MQKEKTIYRSQYIELIEILRKERKRLGLSQKEVATSIGMSQSDLSKIETLERRMDILEFKELLSVYRCPENLPLKKHILSFLDLED